MTDPELSPTSLPRGQAAVSQIGSAVDPIPITLSYHQQTKHHLNRYARSLGYLDWASQPDPFRTFQGAVRVELPLAANGLTTSYADLYTPLAIQARPLDLESIAILFELALGLSAWKEFRAIAGPCAAIPAAAICTPRRVTLSCRRCRTWRPASVTMSAAIISWRGAVFWRRRGQWSWPGLCLPTPSW